MKKPKISVCLIVKNEEKRLPLILNDVALFADEIIVVDTGSTDDSVNVAEKYGARVAHYRWTDDFSAARNKSISLATGEWIVWLDADDRVAAEESALIVSCIKRAKRDEAFTVEVVNSSIDSRPSSFIQLRIFPNNQGLFFEGRIHESVAGIVKQKKFNIISSGAKIVHTGYESADARKAKMERNFTLLSLELESDPDNIAHRFLLAGSLVLNGRMEEAANHYEKIAFTKGAYEKQADVLVRSLVALARWHRDSGRFSAAEQWAKEAVAKRGDDMEALYELASAQAARGDIGSAFRIISEAFKCEPYISSVVVDFINVRAAMYELIIKLLRASQKHIEAGEWLRKGIAELPYSPEMVKVASGYYLSIKRPDLAIKTYKQAISRMAECKKIFETAIAEIERNLQTESNYEINNDIVKLISVSINNVLIFGDGSIALLSLLKERGAKRIDTIGGHVSMFDNAYTTCNEIARSGVLYDTIIFGNAFEVADNPIALLTAAAKVLSLNGNAIFDIKNGQHYSVFSSIVYGLLGNSFISGQKKSRLLTLDQFIAVIERNGFKVDKIIEVVDQIYNEHITEKKSTMLNLGKASIELTNLTPIEVSRLFSIRHFVSATLISKLTEVASGSSAVKIGKEIKIDKLKQDGIAFIDKGNFAEAASCFIEYISLSPDRADGYAYLALTEWHRKRFQDAYYLCRHALSISAADPEIADIVAKMKE